MKTYLTCFLLLLAITVNAQRIKLNFEPQGRIIKFDFEGLAIYTDTAALFTVYRLEGSSKDYDLRVKNFMLRQINESKTDTLTFSGSFIPFNDGIGNEYQKDWYVDWAIFELLKAGKLKMYDTHGQPVKTIVTKKVGKKKNNYVKRSYINKGTHEELLKQVLFHRIMEPVF